MCNKIISLDQGNVSEEKIPNNYNIYFVLNYEFLHILNITKTNLTKT